MFVFDFDFKSFDCNLNNFFRDSVLFVVGVVFLCIVVLVFCYNYCYEIYFLCNNFIKFWKNNFQYKNDVYIIVYEDD